MSPPSLKVNEQDILKAAARIFRERGYHGTSVQDIADAVGLKKGSLYYHITSKEDLLVQIVASAIDWLVAGFEAIYAQPLSPGEKLSRAIAQHVEAITERRDEVAVFLQERNAIPAEHAVRYQAQRDRYDILFRQVIEEGIASGEFRAVDPRLATLAILGMLIWVKEWYRPDGRYTPEEIAAQFTQYVVDGLLRP